jgi:hypothetical protein
MAERENQQHIRRTLAEFAERNSDVLQKFFEDAMSADRTISVLCKNFGRRELVEVPDWRARQLAVAELLNQGFRRPGTEKRRDRGRADRRAPARVLRRKRARRRQPWNWLPYHLRVIQTPRTPCSYAGGRWFDPNRAHSHSRSHAQSRMAA